MTDLFLRIATDEEIERLDEVDFDFEQMQIDDALVACIGRIYRASISQFVDTRGAITFRQKFSMLKRKSCKKEYCSSCNAMDDFIEELGLPEEMLWGVGDAENGKAYRLEWFESDSDFETGIKEYSLKFYEVAQ